MIEDVPGEGAWNMSLDESLLEGAARGRPTLRLYGWREPTLTLGYFQELATRSTHRESAACPLVRRSTGGGAILHDRELTYALTLPDPPRAELATLVDRVHRSLVEALRALDVDATLAEGPGDDSRFLCFERQGRGDVLVGGHKIAGSAQRRRRGGVLQHGSILLSRSPAAPQLPGIVELSRRAIDAAVLWSSWRPLLATALNATWLAGECDDSERSLAESLLRERFAHDTWTQRR